MDIAQFDDGWHVRSTANDGFDEYHGVFMTEKEAIEQAHNVAQESDDAPGFQTRPATPEFENSIFLP